MSANDIRRHRRWANVLFALLLPALGACDNGASRRPTGGRRPPHRLDGAWTLDLHVERPMSLSYRRVTLPFTVGGTMMLMTNESADVSFESVAVPTQIGVYALQLDSLGLVSWPRDDVPTVAAREVALDSSPATSRDSVLIVLNPVTPGRMLRLNGRLVDGMIRGTWAAESPLGGGGTFEMRRVEPGVPASH